MDYWVLFVSIYCFIIFFYFNNFTVRYLVVLKMKKRVGYNLLFSCFVSEMGAKAKKAMKKNLKKASSQLVASARKTGAADFLVW
jgi:hypothetical protein